MRLFFFVFNAPTTDRYDDLARNYSLMGEPKFNDSITVEVVALEELTFLSIKDYVFADYVRVSRLIRSMICHYQMRTAFTFQTNYQLFGSKS